MSNTLSFLVDIESVRSDPDLPHLRSFVGVDGLSIEEQVALVTRPGQDSMAVLGATGNHRVSLAPLNQFKTFAEKIAARPGCNNSTEVIERALAYSFLAVRLDISAVVSPARAAFGPDDRGLVNAGSLVTVAEALAMIGANVRQREIVPLGGAPLMTQNRNEVYRRTAIVVIPSGQHWWECCVRSPHAAGADLIGHGGAVFTRVGQALRGRDAVHEALRLGRGRAAILDALYHFDVVLTSSVASLDALARVASEVFRTSGPVEKIGWQRPWRNELRRIVPGVADVVAPETRLGAALLILTRLRNSIHGIPLDEYLQVLPNDQSGGAEHRVMLENDLALRLVSASAPLGKLDAYGIFVEPSGFSFINIAQLTEQLLAWTIEIIDELLRAMLASSKFAEGLPVKFSSLELFERELCGKLARVGGYPARGGPNGLPASPSLRRRIMATVHKHRQGF